MATSEQSYDPKNYLHYLGERPRSQAIFTAKLNSLFDENRKIKGTEFNLVKLWTIAEGQQLASFNGFLGEVKSIKFLSNASLLACASDLITVFDLNSGTIADSFSEIIRHDLTDLAISKDYSVLASSSVNNIIFEKTSTISVYDLCNSKKIISIDASDETRSIDLSLSGNAIIAGGTDHAIKMYNIKAPHPMSLSDSSLKLLRSGNIDLSLAKTSKITIDRISNAIFSKDGKDIIITRDNQIEIVDLKNFLSKKKLLSLRFSDFDSVDISFNNKHLVVSRHGIQVYDLQNDKELIFDDLLDLKRNNSTDIFKIAFSPNSQFLAGAGFTYGYVFVYDINRKKRFYTFKSFPLTSRLTFSTNSRFLIQEANYKFYRIWDLFDGKEICIGHDKKNWFTKVCFSPNFKYCAAVTDDNCLILLNVKTKIPSIRWQLMAPLLELIFQNNDALLLKFRDNTIISVKTKPNFSFEYAHSDVSILTMYAKLKNRNIEISEDDFQIVFKDLSSNTIIAAMPRFKDSFILDTFMHPKEKKWILIASKTLQIFSSEGNLPPATPSFSFKSGEPNFFNSYIVRCDIDIGQSVEISDTTNANKELISQPGNKKFLKKEFYKLYNKARNNEAQKKYDIAKKLYIRAIRVAIREDLREEISFTDRLEVDFRIRDLNYLRGDYQKAKEEFRIFYENFSGLVGRESLDYDKLISMAAHRLATIYKSEKDWSNAMQGFFQTQLLLKNANDLNGSRESLYKWAACNAELGNFKLAELVLLKIVKELEAKNEIHERDARVYLAKLAEKRGDYNSAISYQRRALFLSKSKTLPYVQKDLTYLNYLQGKADQINLFNQERDEKAFKSNGEEFFQELHITIQSGESGGGLLNILNEGIHLSLIEFDIFSLFIDQLQTDWYKYPSLYDRGWISIDDIRLSVRSWQIIKSQDPDIQLGKKDSGTDIHNAIYKLRTKIGKKIGPRYRRIIQSGIHKKNAGHYRLAVLPDNIHILP